MCERRTPVIEPVIQILGVSKQFELQGQRIEALRDANLRLQKGEFVCLIGASGCGKSTLLRIVAGFEQPTRGEALMWGKPIDGPAPDRGMVFQDYGLLPWLTVRRNIGFGPAARGKRRTARLRRRIPFQRGSIIRRSARNTRGSPIRAAPFTRR